MLDPVTLTAAAGAVTTIGAFFAGRFMRRERNSTAPGVNKSAQAIADSELVAALSALRLPPDTVRMLRDKVKTLQELEDAVAMLRSGSQVSVQDRMLPCAVAHVRSRYGKHASDIGRLLAIAQCGTPDLLHPAFQSIANDMQVVGEGLGKAMEPKLRQRIEHGPWVIRDLTMRGHLMDRRREKEEGRGKFLPHQTQSWDVIRPLENGILSVVRYTVYDSRAKVTSEWPVTQFDAIADGQPEFWLAFATARIDVLLRRKASTTSYVHGNLLEWTRFVEALQAATST